MSVSHLRETLTFGVFNGHVFRSSRKVLSQLPKRCGCLAVCVLVVRRCFSAANRCSSGKFLSPGCRVNLKPIILRSCIFCLLVMRIVHNPSYGTPKGLVRIPAYFQDQTNLPSRHSRIMIPLSRIGGGEATLPLLLSLGVPKFTKCLSSSKINASNISMSRIWSLKAQPSLP